MSIIKVFCAYPSNPARISETITQACRDINFGQVAKLRTWEELATGGKVLINTICSAIDESQLLLADLTGFNPNVLFELGYAITREKRVWPIIDTTLEKSRNNFRSFQSLTHIGYTEYVNSGDIVKKFYEECPFNDLHDTIFKSVELNNSLDAKPSLLYLKSYYEDNASRVITKRVESSCITKIFRNDPKELSSKPLTWHANEIYQSAGVICHLSNPERQDALTLNSVYTLLAGMALGLDKKLLMLIETSNDYLSPLDIRQILKIYSRATEAENYLVEWIEPIEAEWRERDRIQVQRKADHRLASELRELYFGDPLAENEIDELDKYFVETAAYNEAINGRHTIFVGRKGSGKTANLHQIASTLEKPANLICKIQPVGYELQGLLDFLRANNALNLRNYAIESLWKFLIYSEVAQAAANEIIERGAGTPSPEEQKLIDAVRAPNGSFEDFSSRLDRSVRDFVRNPTKGVDGPVSISEALHKGAISQLCKVMSAVLSRKRRIAILIDNLDKAWDDKNDLEDLSDFLLGLINASGQILNNLKHDLNRTDLNISLAIFLRSDIFSRIQAVALEPDKIRFYRMTWAPEDLIQLIEERFIASHDNTVSADEMWGKYFCLEVDGIATADYLTQRTFPRPRDLILFVSQAVRIAVNHKHTKVEETDILEAEKEVSANAFQSIIVENYKRIPALEDVLFEFSGSKSVLSESEIYSFIQQVQGTGGQESIILDLLVELNFLGLQVNDEKHLRPYSFPEDPQDLRRSRVLARNFHRNRGTEPFYQIHPTFWKFLEVNDNSSIAKFSNY